MRFGLFDPEVNNRGVCDPEVSARGQLDPDFETTVSPVTSKVPYQPLYLVAPVLAQ